ncbi:UNVERIFIED_CONTAM: hypothetical protein FKN15_002079 [Acipenser sinensis]
MDPSTVLAMFREQEEKREDRVIRHQEQLAQFFRQLVEKMTTAPLTSETAVARMFSVQPKLQKMTLGDNPEPFLITVVCKEGEDFGPSFEPLSVIENPDGATTNS